MRRRWGLRLAGVVVVVGVWLAAASVAWGSYTVTPMCTSAGQTSACGSGWYVSGVLLTWTWSPMDGSNPASGCVPQSYVHDTSANPACDVAGPSGEGSATQPIRVETSIPTAAAVPTRPPDSNGWYNHPLTVGFQGSAFSGISSCTAPTYAGPDSTTAQVSGSCVDNAGKTASASFTLAYDTTPPALLPVAAPGDRSVRLSLLATDIAPLASIDIVRSPGLGRARKSTMYRGQPRAYNDGRVRNGRRYTYTFIASDAAGNVAERTVTIVPGPRLLGPTSGAIVTAPPLLSWTPVRRTSYYNVQLYRGKRKILSIWPAHAKLQLRSTWKFARHRWRLKPAQYRWYVWPGFGRRSAGRYGHLIGSGTFVVSR